MLELDTKRARRLALLAAGLLHPEWIGLEPKGSGKGRVARESALGFVRHFGYLQLDTVSVAGMRSHPMVLWSRHPKIDPALGEELLRPGTPLFEYWGHEACWLPMELYPYFQFRRDEFRDTKWWKDIQKRHRTTADEILARIRNDGPIRSQDLEGKGGGGWWEHKPAKRIVVALWFVGDLAIRERTNFQRTFDLPERVVPSELREKPAGWHDSARELIALALRGHGWATIGTLARTWRYLNCRPDLRRALEELEADGRAAPCDLLDTEGKRISGWIDPIYLPFIDRLARLRPNTSRARLLSPFDPVLWDRGRVATLFGFEQTLEIFKPAPQRKYGYFCLPVLAGDQLIGRVDPKADRKTGTLHALSEHLEPEGTRETLRSAFTDFAGAMGLAPRFTSARAKSKSGGRQSPTEAKRTSAKGQTSAAHSTRKSRPVASAPPARRRRK
ncbi:MAG: YcaQ family DNA glycosylase [Candidatus Eisenbacteria bacterium]|uniref:YcaQ family DNA glycosylase n=1 Tax=Eiseniibacteriota bacterium TaxID=2212470 RepID=A0A956NBB4_UNCEI|nr:YcaQ family DNA glycosylase [Candidatus Eisenbacteria bacterium]